MSAELPSSLVHMGDAGTSISGREVELLAQFIERLDAVERLTCTERIKALKKILSTTLADLGFSHFAYHVARASGVAGNGRLLCHISNYPDSWITHYQAEHYIEEDPVVGHFLRHRRPFMWSEVADPADLSRRQRRLFEESRSAGLINGVTLPIHGRGEVAAISVVPDESDDRAAALIGRNQHLLRLIALPFHAAACSALLEKSLTGDSVRRRSLLSPRETQVLEWTAKGKSSWEISTILCISEKGVEFHMESAKRKLQVFNRPHAVAKAIMLNLLSLN